MHCPDRGKNQRVCRNHIFIIPVCLVALLLLIIIPLSCNSGDSTDHGDYVSVGTVEKFFEALADDNFIVQEGEARNIDVLKSCNDGLLPSCYGNNQGAPYCMFLLPPSPNQNPALGQNPPIGYNPDNPDNYPANPDTYPPGASSKLRVDEAVVFVGKTPPECKFFSFVPYIALTENIPGKDYTGVHPTGNDIVGHYHRIFGSLSDPVNRFNIKSEYTPDGKEGDPFNCTTVIVFAADKATAQRVENSLVRAGYSSNIINQVIIPSTVLKMGLERGKDTFIFLVRMAQWTDTAAGEDYLANLKTYGRVFRVTSDGSVPVDPYPMTNLKPRGNGKTEFEMVENLTEDLNTLRAGIIRKYAAEGYTYKDYSTEMWIPDGLVGYANDTDCLGDTRDTTYLRTGDFQLNSDDDFVVVYGLNHDTTGKSIYGNAVVYGTELLNGVVNIFSKYYPGTANEFFPENYHNAQKYYAYMFARQKPDAVENCVVIPKSTGNPQGITYGIDNGQDMFIVFRAYYEKETRIGPSYSEIAHDRVIVFHKKD